MTSPLTAAEVRAGILATMHRYPGDFGDLEPAIAGISTVPLVWRSSDPGRADIDLIGVVEDGTVWMDLPPALSEALEQARKDAVAAATAAATSAILDVLVAAVLAFAAEHPEAQLVTPEARARAA
ncbi:MAG: hypothetical protein EPN50_06155 [Chloroflexota bacterium]|nr:MAG: hypothetical protein EPN50_06155 [Chloroflexota bacterium]